MGREAGKDRQIPPSLYHWTLQIKKNVCNVQVQRWPKSFKQCRQKLNSAAPRMKHGVIDPIINQWQNPTLWFWQNGLHPLKGGRGLRMWCLPSLLSCQSECSAMHPASLALLHISAEQGTKAPVTRFSAAVLSASVTHVRSYPAHHAQPPCPSKPTLHWGPLLFLYSSTVWDTPTSTLHFSKVPILTSISPRRKDLLCSMLTYRVRGTEPVLQFTSLGTLFSFTIWG